MSKEILSLPAASLAKHQSLLWLWVSPLGRSKVSERSPPPVHENFTLKAILSSSKEEDKMVHLHLTVGSRSEMLQ